MKRNLQIDNKLITEDSSPYIIAEACNNFNGDMAVAEQMIIEARDCDCDAIKFQMRLQKDRITPDQHMELQELCKQADITYLCTAFDLQGLQILDEMNVPAIKIGSAECNNESFLKQAHLLDAHLIISTGGCTPKDVHMIAKYADIMLHCTSMYPTPYTHVNLDLINWYGLDYPEVYIGYSDHTKDVYAAMGAVALGAKVIEKHFVLDYHMDTTDMDVSLDPIDMGVMVAGCRAIHEAKGSKKEFYPEEEEKLRAWR